MRQMIVATSAALLGLVASYGTASAQVYVETDDGAAYYDYAPSEYVIERRPAARAYGYTRYYYTAPADTDVIVTTRPLNCGTYHYWNGTRCVDARYIPPGR